MCVFTCVDTNVSADAFAYRFMCVGKPEVDMEYHTRAPSILYIDTGFLIEPRAHCFS